MDQYVSGRYPLHLYYESVDFRAVISAPLLFGLSANIPFRKTAWISKF